MYLIISLIVAMTKDRIIGKNNRIPWKSSEDMKYFKEMTMDKPIIMGRNTWDSLRIKPLPGRYNIVLTKNEELIGNITEGEFGPWFHDNIDDVIDRFEEVGCPEMFVIGGQNIYEEFLNRDLVDQMYINVMNTPAEGNVFFPFIEKSMWKIEESETKFNDFRAFLYTRNKHPEDYDG